MVGSVHFVVFFGCGWVNSWGRAFSSKAPGRDGAHRRGCAKNRSAGKWPVEDRPTSTPVADMTALAPDPVPPPPHRLPCCWSGTYPRDSAHRQPVQRSMHHESSLWNTRPSTPERDAGSSPALWTRYPPPPHRTSDYSPDTYPLAANHRPSRHCSNPTNKNGVFHVKHAARFPPTAATIKPSSSPTRGTFRSRADSAQVRLPALPAQTRPSPAHNRSRRSATRPVRSARSAASQRPYHATH